MFPWPVPCKRRLKEHCRSGCALSSQTTADAFANPTLGARLSFEAELCESPVSLSVFATRFTLWHQHVCSYGDRMLCLQDAGRCIVRQTQTNTLEEGPAYWKALQMLLLLPVVRERQKESWEGEINPLLTTHPTQAMGSTSAVPYLPRDNCYLSFHHPGLSDDIV